MRAFYNITTKLRETLEADPFVNTVTYGDLSKVDIHKQNIFPLSHFVVDSAQDLGPVWRFTITLLCMDLVDFTKDHEVDKFIGEDNEHDVLNTQLAVISKVTALMRRGQLVDELYQLSNEPTAEPFVERFENQLAGWSITFTIDVPNNEVSVC